MSKKVYLSIFCALLMSANAADLGTVNVESSTISDLATDKKTEVSTVNTIDEKKIEIVDPKNIGEVLNTIPGITADVRSGETVEIHMRGVGQQEFMWEDTGVAVVIDGVPVLQNGGKVKLNLDDIESIKVIKGGASYLYGRNALAGAIMITTKKAKNRNENSVKYEYGSENYNDLVASLIRGTDKYSFILNANYRYTDGYWDMSQLEDKSANGKFQYYLDDMSDITVGANIERKYEESSRGSVTGVSAAQTNPTGANDGDLPWNSDYYSDIDKYFVTYNRDFENGNNLRINTYYYQDLYNFLSSPQDLNGDGNDDGYTSDNDENIKQYGVKSEYRGEKNNLAYMFGLDLGQRDLDDSWIKTETYTSRGRWYYKGESSESDTSEKNSALYAEAKYKVNEKFTAVFNARADYTTFDYDVFAHDYNGTTWSDSSISRTTNFSNFSYRVGGTYELNEKNTLYTNFSTGFRNPRVYELYAHDFDPDRYTKNNTEIDTETTFNIEAGVRGSKIVSNTKLSYDLSIYQIDTKDIIGKIGGTYYSGGTNVYFDNIGDARSRGVEFSLKSDKRKKLAFELAYTYLDAFYTSHKPFTVDLAPIYRSTGDKTYDIDGNQLPRTPHHKINIMTYLKIAPKWMVVPSYYWQSSYYADETNFVKMPSYGVANLLVKYNTKVKGGDLELFARVDNLFDKQYYRTVYLFSDRSGDGTLDAEDASITVDPGRVFYVGFKYKF